MRCNALDSSVDRANVDSVVVAVNVDGGLYVVAEVAGNVGLNVVVPVPEDVALNVVVAPAAGD